MNNPSPLVPQGSMLEQKNKNRTRVRLAVFFVLSIHVIGLMALLMQGCRKPEPETVPEVAPMQPLPDTAAPPAYTETNLQPMVTEPAPPLLEPVPPGPLPPIPSQEYVVLKGDTLSGIAKKFSVTVKAIEEANPGVVPTKLQIGQKLVIPPPAPGAAGTPAVPGANNSTVGPGGEQVYTVKSGDNLTKIAARFGTTVKALRAENNLETDRIKVGQQLKIPAASSAPPATPEPVPTPPGMTPGM